MRLELWPGGPRIKNADGVFPVGTDSVLLADFAARPGKKRVLDLGCGGGVLAVLLACGNPAFACDLIDVSPEAAALARENTALNGLEGRVRVFEGDLRGFPPERGAYDLAVSNPPYFSAQSPSGAMAQARSESGCTIAELCACAARALKTGGALCVVYRPERLAELFSAMEKCALAPKRLRCVSARAGAAPRLVLVEAKLGAKPGLRFLPPLVLADEAGASEEYRRIYHL